jgi:hypothetical protein
MTELDVYRNLAAPEFLLRWVRLECSHKHCMTHHVGVAGFKLASPPSTDWFVPIINIVSPDPEFVDVEVTRSEKAILAKPADSVEGWRLGAAAFGQPWESLSADNLWVLYGLLANLELATAKAMRDEGVAGLLALRRWVGRNSPTAMPVFLQLLARYRANVGGQHKELDLG